MNDKYTIEKYESFLMDFADEDVIENRLKFAAKRLFDMACCVPIVNKNEYGKTTELIMSDFIHPYYCNYVIGLLNRHIKEHYFLDNIIPYLPTDSNNNSDYFEISNAIDTWDEAVEAFFPDFNKPIDAKLVDIPADIDPLDLGLF